MTDGYRSRAYSLTPIRPIALDDLTRLGRDNDGGYVVSRRSIERTRVLLSFGVSDDWSFERDFATSAPEVRLLAFDGSISPRTFSHRALFGLLYAGRGLVRGRVSEVREGVRDATEQRALQADFHSFFSAPRHQFLSSFVGDRSAFGRITLQEIFDRYVEPYSAAEQADVFIKMDIEGAEYRVLPTLYGAANRISGLAIEFHDCDLLWERFVEITARLQESFVVVHVHGNNYDPLIPGTTTPRTLEVTFINRSLVPPTAPWSEARFPIDGLDQPNNRTRDDYHLSFA